MYLFTLPYFNVFLVTMSFVAVIVFVSLYFVDAGYGIMFDKKWGVSVNNKVGWVLMEAPVFFVMLACWWLSDRTWELVPFIFFFLFQLHYFQRSFIFPFLMRGKSRMPIMIMSMGVIFNTLNGLMQGGWIFFVSPEGRYSVDWLTTPQFIVGVLLFLVGMGVNLHSDYIVRHLRQLGDPNHYLPKGGMFDYVTSANYFGELVEWIGFAIMTWSWAGAVFALWTFANLTPRANTIYKRYKSMFPEMEHLHLKRIIPFLY